MPKQTKSRKKKFHKNEMGGRRLRSSLEVITLESIMMKGFKGKKFIIIDDAQENYRDEIKLDGRRYEVLGIDCQSGIIELEIKYDNGERSYVSLNYLLFVSELDK